MLRDTLAEMNDDQSNVVQELLKTIADEGLPIPANEVRAKLDGNVSSARVPSLRQGSSSLTNKNQKSKEGKTEQTEYDLQLGELRNLVQRTKDADQAFIAWNALKENVIVESNLATDLVKLLGLNNRYEEATDVVLHAFRQNVTIYHAILQGYLRALADDRRLDMLNRLDHRLTASQKAFSQFTTFYVRAMDVKGQMNWFRRYVATVQSAEDYQSLKALRRSFPRNEFLKMLERHPDCVEECKYKSE